MGLTPWESPPSDPQFPHALRRYPGCPLGTGNMEQNDIVSAGMLQTQVALSTCSLAPSPALIFLKATQHPLSSHPENTNPVLTLGLWHVEGKDAHGFMQGPYNSAVRRSRGTWIICC